MLTKYRAKLIVIAIVGGILLTVCHRGYVEFISLGLMDDQSGIEVLATDSKETKVAKWRLKQRMNGIKAPKGTSDKEAKVIKYGEYISLITVVVYFRLVRLESVLFSTQTQENERQSKI